MSTPIEQLIVSPISKLYKEHIGFIKAKNLDGLLNQYADDALVWNSTITGFCKMEKSPSTLLV